MILSIVIPTYKRYETLMMCLDCLSPDIQNVAPDMYEVIVTDDEPGSDTEQRLINQYAWVRWVRGPQRGPAANRNNGARNAKAEWVAFTDDDCLPKPSWIQSYLDAMSIHPEVQVFEGKTTTERPQHRYDEEAPINETGGNLWSCNFAIKKNLFEQVGGFDERFLIAWGEDMDLNFRLKKAGAKMLFLPEAEVCHPWRPVRFQKTDMMIHAFKVLRSNNPKSYKLIRHLGSYTLGLPSRFYQLARLGFRGSNAFLRREVSMIYIIVAYSLSSKI